jgi:hypothetical protein
VAYMVFSQERDLGCVDIGATQSRVGMATGRVWVRAGRIEFDTRTQTRG